MEKMDSEVWAGEGEDEVVGVPEEEVDSERQRWKRRVEKRKMRKARGAMVMMIGSLQ
jgi:hypothetical protein